MAARTGSTRVRKHKKALLLLLPLLLLLALALSACQEDTADQNSSQDTSATTEGSTSTQTTQTQKTETTGDGEGQPDGDARSLTQARELVPQTGTFAACADCHAYLDPPDPQWATLNDAVSHVNHLERGTGCQDCHLPPVHTEEGIRLPRMETCFDCHNQEADGVASPACYTCHPSDFPLEPSWHDEEFGQEGHGQRIQREGMDDCFLCHEEVDKKGTGAEFCMDCHGMPVPHAKDWADTSSRGPGRHVRAAHDDPASCTKCHRNATAERGGCYGGECHGPAE